MNNALQLELPQRRRSSSWNPPPNLEWNETTSSLQHLRNSLLKDDGFKASCLQSEMQTKPKVFKAMKSPRQRDAVYTWDVAPKPKVQPKPQRRVISSTDGQNNNSNDTEAPTGQSKYILPGHLDNAKPKPESVISSTDCQNNNSDDTATPTGQSEKKLPWHLDNALPDPESVYMKMQPIKPLPALPKKVSLVKFILQGKTEDHKI